MGETVDFDKVWADKFRNDLGLSRPVFEEVKRPSENDLRNAEQFAAYLRSQSEANIQVDFFEDLVYVRLFSDETGVSIAEFPRFLSQLKNVSAISLHPISSSEMEIVFTFTH